MDDIGLLIDENYYVAVPLIFVGIIIVALIGGGYLWDRKYVPAQQRKGRMVRPFNMVISQALNYAFKEDRAPLKGKSKLAILNKILTYRRVYLILALLTIVFIAIKQPIMAVITLGLIIVIIHNRSTKVMQSRLQITTRIYEVAKRSFSYPRGGELTPWRNVTIKEWLDTERPGETHLNFPPSFDAGMGGKQKFESHFSSSITDPSVQMWSYEWEQTKGIVKCIPVKPIPREAPYKGVEYTTTDAKGETIQVSHAWDKIAIGVGLGGDVVIDLSTNPHILVAGSTGSGKSVLQTGIIFHCIQHNDRWRFLGIDVKRVEFRPFEKYDETVMGIATEVETGLEVLRYVHEIQTTRYEEMESLGVNHFSKLKEPDYAILLMIDETYSFLAPISSKTDEAKAINEMKGEAASLISDLARLGRAAGIHLVLATQRPDAEVISGELKSNLAVRIAAGYLRSTPSSMVLDTGTATQLDPSIKGRGVVSINGDEKFFQGYFAKHEWIDEWLEQHPGHEPNVFPALNPNSPIIEDEDSDVEESFSKLVEEYPELQNSNLNGAPINIDLPEGAEDTEQLRSAGEKEEGLDAALMNVGSKMKGLFKKTPKATTIPETEPVVPEEIVSEKTEDEFPQLPNRFETNPDYIDTPIRPAGPETDATGHSIKDRGPLPNFVRPPLPKRPQQ